MLGLPLLLLIFYRGIVTSRFTLSTEHGGLSILGAYIPGATINGWADPIPYIASERPELLQDHKALLSQATGLAFREALRRPGFQALRILSMLINFAVTGEAASLYWSFGTPEVLPAALQARAQTFTQSMLMPLYYEMACIHGLFLAALLIGVRRRNWAILALGLSIFLKYALHGIVAAQGRYFLPATAMEWMAIVLAVHELVVRRPSNLLRPAFALLLGMAFAATLFEVRMPLLAEVQHRDIDTVRRDYRFPLQSPSRNATLNCEIGEGILQSWTADVASMQIRPETGGGTHRAVAVCDLVGTAPAAPLTLRLVSSIRPGGSPVRRSENVEVDGQMVFSDEQTAAQATAESGIPLGNVGPGTRRKIVIYARSEGDSAVTSFRLSGFVAGSNLAAGRPATQSSTDEKNGSVASRAVDGKTDGNFFHLSVTSTGLDPNAWWQVDLEYPATLAAIILWNRTDCCDTRLSDYWVFVSEAPFSPTDTPALLARRAGTWSSHQTASPFPAAKLLLPDVRGRYVRVQLDKPNYLSLAEVQVFGSKK